MVTAAEVGGLALAFGALGPVMGGMISDRLGRTTAASLILGLSALCAVSLAWIGHWPWGLIVAASVVFGWAASADSAIYQTGITEVADPRRLGSTMALQASLGLLGGVIGPVLFGGILDASVSEYRWVFRFLHPRRPRRDCDSRPSQSQVADGLPSARKGRSVGMSRLPAPPPKEAQSDAY